jgi:hypothetical protein
MSCHLWLGHGLFLSTFRSLNSPELFHILLDIQPYLKSVAT